jgi:hypothetical protein
MNDRTISIFEEYCNSVKQLPEGDSVEVTVSGKYFTELYTRVMLHGWACISIISDDSDNHIAMFVATGSLGMLDSLMEGGFDMDEMFGDDFKDDDSDWWKH